MKIEQMELMEDGGLSPVAFSRRSEKDLSFAQSLAAIRSEREMTIIEIAEKTRQATRTVQRWLAGKTVPEASFRKHVLRILSDPNGEPSARTRRRVEQSHHLIWDKQKGWEMKVTVNVGKKVVGKRIRERLKTRCLAEAIARRDLIVGNMKKLGLTIEDRRQKTRKPRL